MKQTHNLTSLIIPGAFAILSGILINIIDTDFLSSYIKEWPKTTLFIIVLLSIVSLWFFIYYLRYQKEDSKGITIPSKPWKHSILICDDKAKVLATISDGLKGYDYDYVTLKDLTDYRLAANFEIIIGDIFGIGATDKSVSVLNTIKEKFPYKVVIAMSASNMSEFEDLNKDILFVLKDREMKYVKQLRYLIKTYSEELNNVDEHWETTSKQLSSRNVDTKGITAHKNNYYNYINSLTN